MAADLHHLRAAGTSLVVDLGERRLPRVLHWGADLGDLDPAELSGLAVAGTAWVGDSAVTYPQPVPILGQLAEGWLERPGLSGCRVGQPDQTGAGWAPLFVTTSQHVQEDADVSTLVVDAADRVTALTLRLELGLDRHGVVRTTLELRNVGDSDYLLTGAELALPVPDIATELLDFTGRWSLEHVPQRLAFNVGQWVREARGGKPGLEGVGLLAAGERGFTFQSGQVWLTHLAWSGSQTTSAIRTPYDTRRIGAGELLNPGEVMLAPGESYRSPDLLGSWGNGLDAAAARFHSRLRGLPRRTPPRRPVTVNTWEAVGFDHDETRLLEAADRAAHIGAERFVLDDGWFTGRHDDTGALGDWWVCPHRWPNGLRPLADRVHALGMEFGLWVEPEMISPSSRLASDHPEWLFDAGHGPGLTSRHQWVLDLGHELAYQHVLDALTAVIAGAPVDAVKWDHNRYLLDAGHQPDGRSGQRAQTQAALAMMAEIQARFPSLDIETCASGGGRADHAVLALASRMWPSDCNDPHERAAIVRWTQLLVPPDMIGTHIGASPDHITGRSHALGFRAMLAVWGHFGIETDLNSCSPAELDELASWVAVHKELRPLLLDGTAVHEDGGQHRQIDGLVSSDQTRAAYLVVQRHRPPTWPEERIRLPGLDPDVRYRVEICRASHDDLTAPAWASGPLVAKGRVLTEVGLEALALRPDSGFVLTVTRVDGAG